MNQRKLTVLKNTTHSMINPGVNKQKSLKDNRNNPAEILFITSYPPRVCGIATYSDDLIKALNNKLSNALSINVCALESNDTNYAYPGEVKYILKTAKAPRYHKLASEINNDEGIRIVLIQHEFGFYKVQEYMFGNMSAKYGLSREPRFKIWPIWKWRHTLVLKKMSLIQPVLFHEISCLT